MTNDNSNFLSAEDILNANDIDYAYVEVPEWKKNGKPGVICFRAMTANEAIKFVTEGEKNKGDNYVRIVAATAVKMNEDGTPSDQPLFVGDVAVYKLKEKKSGIFIRLQKTIMKLNNLDGGDEAAAAKNA